MASSILHASRRTQLTLLVSFVFVLILGSGILLGVITGRIKPKASADITNQVQASYADSAGQPYTNQSNIVTTTLVSADSTPPTVGITSPANGTTVSGTVQVVANATDNVGVSKVEFLLDNLLKSTDTSSPFEWSWDSKQTSNGVHALIANAYDSANNKGVSPTVSVTVNNVATNQPPVASFTVNPQRGKSPLVVTFDASASSDPDNSSATDKGIVEFSWNFGDGQTGTGKVVQHAYTVKGSYSPTLTVKDNKGATNSKTLSNGVRVTGAK